MWYLAPSCASFHKSHGVHSCFFLLSSCVSRRKRRSAQVVPEQACVPTNRVPRYASSFFLPSFDFFVSICQVVSQPPECVCHHFSRHFFLYLIQPCFCSLSSNLFLLPCLTFSRKLECPKVEISFTPSSRQFLFVYNFFPPPPPSSAPRGPHLKGKFSDFLHSHLWVLLPIPYCWPNLPHPPMTVSPFFLPKLLL